MPAGRVRDEATKEGRRRVNQRMFERRKGVKGGKKSDLTSRVQFLSTNGFTRRRRRDLSHSDGRGSGSSGCGGGVGGGLSEDEGRRRYHGVHVEAVDGGGRVGSEGWKEKIDASRVSSTALKGEERWKWQKIHSFESRGRSA